MKLNETEKKVLEMSKRGERLHGLALDILFDLALREMEETERGEQENPQEEA